MKKQDNRLKLKIAGIAVIVIIVLTFLFNCFYHVTPGNRGVLVTLGKVSAHVYPNGVGLKPPFVSSMYKMDVRTRTIKDKSSTYTSDVQSAEVDYIVTYNLNPDAVATLFETVGTDYVGKKITPILTDVLKDVIGKWQAQDLVANRDKARTQILCLLQERLDKRFFQNITFQITNLDYSDNFEKAIENKVIAEQKAQEAVNNTQRIKEEAEQKVIAAQAESEAMKIKTEALARDKSLIDYEAVQKWDGKLPQYMLGSSTPFINIK